MTAEPLTVAGFEPAPGHARAEQVVVGTALWSTEWAEQITAVIRPEQFYKPAHQVIMAAVGNLLNNGAPVDPVSVMGELNRTGQLAVVGGGPYLATCFALQSASGPYHAERVAADWSRRRLWEFSVRVQQMSGSPEFDPAHGFDLARDWLDDVVPEPSVGGPVDLEELTRALIDELEAEAEPVIGLPTGFADLDSLLAGGLRPGQMVILAARPAIGKSAIALNIASNIALRCGKRVHFHSLEMPKQELGLRLLAAEARVPLMSLIRRRGKDIDDRQWTRLQVAYEQMSNGLLVIDDAHDQSLQSIRKMLRDASHKNPAGLVVIDYLQLMDAPKREKREQEIAALTRGLKKMAREFNVPVLVLSQLNRNAEHRTGKRPEMSDLRESGAQEQDADVVILLHRCDAHDPTDRPGEMDLIVAKHRNGPIATITVAFQGVYARAMDMAPI